MQQKKQNLNTMDTEAQKTKTRKEKNLVLPKEWVENADTSINPC